MWVDVSRNRWLACILLQLIVFAVYWPGLDGPLVLDDFPTLGPLMSGSFDANPGDALMSHTGPLGRPVSMLTFLFNQYLSGANVWFWKLTNVAVHVLNGFLLFAIFERISRYRSRAGGTASDWIPIVAVAMWTLHPLHPSAVLYTVQRMTELSAFFTLAGLLSYLYGRTSVLRGNVAHVLMWLTFVVFMPLAVLSKETGFLLPGYVAILEFTVLRTGACEPTEKVARLLRAIFFWLPLLMLSAYVLVRFQSVVVEPHLRRGFYLSERLLTEGRVVGWYVAQVLVPVREALGFFHDDLELSTSLLSPWSTLPCLILVGSLIGIGVALRARFPMIALGVLWFMWGHSIESTVIPLELMFEHRNYLPSAGILLATVEIVAGAVRSTPARWILGCTALLTVTGLCLKIVGDWRSAETFYLAAKRAHPRSPGASANIADLHTVAGRYREAYQALSDVPVGGAGLQRLYIRCKENGQLSSADLRPEMFKSERVVNSYAATGLMELSRLRLDGKCDIPHQDLLGLLREALRHPFSIGLHRAALWLYTAQLHRLSGEDILASEALASTLQAKPDDPTPLFLQAEWHIEDQEWESARKALENADMVPALKPEAFAEQRATLLRKLRARAAQEHVH